MNQRDTEVKDIAIYGAGGLGREIAAMLKLINRHSDFQWNLIGFFDDGISKGTPISHFGKCLGGIDEVNNWSTSLNIALCIGNTHTMATVYHKINNPMIDFPNIICPDLYVADRDSFRIGKGNIIAGQCIVTTNVSIGNFNILNGAVTLGHDVSIGDFNSIMPGVRISGEVTVGKGNLFGAMSFVKQGLKIGDNITLSPLSPLLSKPKDGQLYIGNPAKIFKF